VIAAWPTLPEALRAAVLALVTTTAAGAATGDANVRRAGQ
jgi:hypothetical protein